MPELPEVEVSRLGIQPYLEGVRVARVIVRQPQLRWPIPEQVHNLEGEVIQQVRRRAKYLLLESAAGCAILHLGMSGRLRVIPAETPVQKHDHVDIVLEGGLCLRLNDPRRFGALLWSETPETHPQLAHLGPEPLSEVFDAVYLQGKLERRHSAIKTLLMDNKVVVGVGNIYANEALFLAGIDPRRTPQQLTADDYQRLVATIKQVLREAITQGGTTLRDFAQVDGKPGYFALKLHVYGRGEQPCLACGSLIRQLKQGQRSSFYCPHCQS